MSLDKPRRQRPDRGPLNVHWKGGRSLKDGYIIISANRIQKREHIAIVERVLGHSLLPPAIVHHVNQQRSDNRCCNLVVLQDRAEHQELHRKMRVRLAGGKPWIDYLCGACHMPKPADAFYTRKHGARARCIECARIDARERQRMKRGSVARYGKRQRRDVTASSASTRAIRG